MLPDINISAFKEPLQFILLGNITKKCCAKLAGLLALDYAIRLKPQLSEPEHAGTCVNKLQNFLGAKVVGDESFATALMLFSIAIAPGTINYQDKDNTVNKENSLDSMAEAILGMHFSDSSKEEKTKIKLMLKELLNGKDSHTIANYINGEPKLIKSIVKSALKMHSKQVDMNNFVKTTVTQILTKSVNIENKISIFKQAASRAAMVVGALAVAALAIATSGVALPIIMVPATIIAIKFAPTIGEKVGSVIISTDRSIKSELSSLKKLKSTMLEKMQNVEQHAGPEKHEAKSKNLEASLDNLKSQKLDVIKGNLHTHLSTEKEVEDNKKLPQKLAKSREKERGR